jgi:hypothetical protein
MATFRTILAYLIALAVAVAPVAAMVIAGAPAAQAAPVHDCHSMAPEPHQGVGCMDAAATVHDCHGDISQDPEKDSCPDCDAKRHAKCVGDGGKCCKLTGVVALLPLVMATAEITDLAANPPMLTGREIQPPPPPPRT